MEGLQEMSWNHRVFRIRNKRPSGGTETFYGIKEVYYNKKGRADGWTKDFIDPGGNTISELREVLTQMLASTYKPVFNRKETLAKKKLKDG